MKQRVIIVIKLFLVGVLLALTLPTQAKEWVPEHELECGEAFPCSDALQRRVDFWIEVFSSWSKDDVILHDAQSPWRVYKVINGYDSCSARKSKRERKRLKANLNALADRLKQGQAPKGNTQRALATHFSSLNVKSVRAAAKNIRCQTGVKDQFVNALSRYARYSPMIISIIADMKMSPEFQYLPFVESSFRPDAYSKVGAAGMWQIMPATARTLGMQIDATIDERLDPAAATRGAMRYFKEAKSKLSKAAKESKPHVTDAELAPFIVTSYNYGMNGMRRAIDKMGPDFDKVLREYKSHSFRVAVKNFYASFLAARHLARNQSQYFDSIDFPEAYRADTLLLKHPTSIERIKHSFSLDETQLRPFNPALTRFVWHNWRLIPAGYRLSLPPKQNHWRSEIRALEALQPEDELTTNVVYRVRKGDTACAIAHAFKVRCKDLIEVNRLGKRGRIRIGQRLDIPGKFRRAKKRQQLAKQPQKKQSKNSPNTPPKKSKAVPALEQTGQYIVRRGDTACGIANQFNVSCRKLIRQNRLGRSAKIKRGQRLDIPGLVSRKAQVASGGAETKRYIVRNGDTVCQIAESFDVPCSRLLKANRLNRKARIRVGQKLSIPGTETRKVSVAKPKTSVVQAMVSALDEIPSLKLEVKSVSGIRRYAVVVAAEETLGHYADWLGGGSSRVISALNKMKHKQAIKPGEVLRLPIKTEAEAQKFSQNRAEYHQVLIEELKEHFELTGQQTIKIRKGDSLWQLARDYHAPLWLLYRMNSSLNQSLRPGQEMVVPILKAKSK